LKGTVHSELDQIEEMLNAFNNALVIGNKYSTKIDEYKSYQWANNFNRGVNQFQLGKKSIDDNNSKIHYELAIEAYKKAVVLKPDSGETYRNLAFVYLTTNKTEESVEPLKKLVEIEQAEEGYQYLGEVYYTLGANMMNDFKFGKNAQDSIKAMDYYDKSIVTVEEGLKKYPENSEMQVARTSAYIGAGRIAEAIAASKILVENEPDNKIYHYNYGVLLLNSEKYPEAETQLLEALKIDPEYENAIYNIGVTYVKWGTAMNKEAELQGVISEDYKKKYEAALPYLEKVVEKDQTNVAIWELLGKVYSVLGMTEDATNAFNQADKLR